MYKRNFDKSFYLLLFPIAHSLIPWLQFRIRAAVPFVFCAVWLVIVFCRPAHVTLSLRKLKIPAYFVVFWFVIYSFSKDVWAFLGRGEHTEYYQFATVLGAFTYFFVAYFAVTREKFRELAFLAKFSMGCVIVSFLCSINGASHGVEYGARALTSSFGDEAQNQGFLAVTYGIGGYFYQYVCAFLAPTLIIAARVCKVKRLKIMLWLVFLSCYVIVLLGGLGTPMFIFLLESGLAFLCIWLKFIRLPLVVGAFLAIGLMIFAVRPKVYSFCASPLRYLGVLYGEETPVGSRLISFSEAVSGNLDAYAFERYQLQMRSWDTFCKHPLIGVGDYNFGNQKARELGGHSCLLDRMGAQGLVGTIPLFLFLIVLYYYCRRLSKLLGSNALLQMVSVYYAGLFVGIVANPIPSIPATFYFLIPGVIVMINSAVPPRVQMPTRRTL